MSDDAGLRRLFAQVASGEPADLRKAYLAVPRSERLAAGSTVPLLGIEMEPRSSGLIVPAETAGARLAAYGRRYMTAAELLDGPVTLERLHSIVAGHATEHILSDCAQLMAWLYERHPTSLETQRELVERFLAPESKKTALAGLNDDWVFLAPQVVMAVAKYAVLNEELGALMLPDTTMSHVLEACLGIAQYLGSYRDDEDDDRWWGTLSRPLALELVQNQHFNNAGEVGTLLGRRQRMRALAAAEFPDELRRADEVFEETTGTTPDVLLHVGLTVWSHTHGGSVVRLARSSFDQLQYPAGQVDAALRLLAPTIDVLRKETRSEFDRTGRFDWSFNTFRRYPMVTLASGNMLCLSPPFLLDHITGEGQFFTVLDRMNRRKKRSKAGRQEAGAFDNYMGHLPEHYVIESLEEMTAGTTGMGQRLWREEELQQIWPGVKCCDALVDGGGAWVAIEIYSHHMSEGATAGDAIEHLEKDLEHVITEARQLDATIGRLIEGGGALPGEYPRTFAPKYHPVVIAASGFPWNPISAAAIHGRLAEEGLLQHPLIHPLTVIGIDELEEIEGAVADRTTGLVEFFDRRVADHEVGHPIDGYLARNGLGLRRPPRLNGPLEATFADLMAALDLRDGGSEVA